MQIGTGITESVGMSVIQNHILKVSFAKNGTYQEII